MRDFVVNILVKIGLYKHCIELINRFKFKLQARRVRRYGLEMLDAAEAALNEIGLQGFITYGTLLGAYREHGFIAYDPDIDLGVIASTVPSDGSMQAALHRHGLTCIRQNEMADEQHTIIEQTYSYKKITLDIFFYYQDGTDYYCTVAQKHESKDWKEANRTDGFPCKRAFVPVCEMEQREFLGRMVWMPVDTDGWLRAMYSDSYMTPIKNWEPTEKYVTRVSWIKERSYRKLFE